MDRTNDLVAQQSFLCRSVIPTSRCVSSRDVGWRSLLVDVHSGVRCFEPYTSVHTPDPRIGVTLNGRYSCDFFTRGRWRHDEHGPGTVMVHRTGEITRYRWHRPRDPSYRLALMYLPVAQLQAAAEHLRRPGQHMATTDFASVVTEDPAISATAHALVQAMSTGIDDLYAQSASLWLCMHLLTRHAGRLPSEKRRSAGVLSDARLARVIDYMRTHYGGHVTLDALAAVALVSRFHFVRMFRQKVGASPYQYLMEIRLTQSAALLSQSQLPVAQIGTACGFPRSAGFSTAFKARFGVSPAGFRRRARGDGSDTLSGL